jgi:hypothetical protein
VERPGGSQFSIVSYSPLGSTTLPYSPSFSYLLRLLSPYLQSSLSESADHDCNNVRPAMRVENQSAGPAATLRRCSGGCDCPQGNAVKKPNAPQDRTAAKVLNMIDSYIKGTGSSLLLILLALFIARAASYFFLLPDLAIDFFRPTPHPKVWGSLATTLSYWVPLALCVGFLRRGSDSRYVIVIPNAVFASVYIAYNIFARQWPYLIGNGLYGWAYGFPGPALILVICTGALLEALLNVLATRLILRRRERSSSPYM